MDSKVISCDRAPLWMFGPNLFSLKQDEPNCPSVRKAFQPFASEPPVHGSPYGFCQRVYPPSKSHAPPSRTAGTDGATGVGVGVAVAGSGGVFVGGGCVAVAAGRVAVVVGVAGTGVSVAATVTVSVGEGIGDAVSVAATVAVATDSTGTGVNVGRSATSFSVGVAGAGVARARHPTMAVNAINRNKNRRISPLESFSNPTDSTGLRPIRNRRQRFALRTNPKLRIYSITNRQP